MKMLKKFFSVASKVDKGKSKSKPEERIAKRVKLRPEKIAEIDGKEKKTFIVWLLLCLFKPKQYA